jgi:hypothetical protein
MQECYKKSGHDAQGEGLKEGTRPQANGNKSSKTVLKRGHIGLMSQVGSGTQRENELIRG